MSKVRNFIETSLASSITSKQQEDRRAEIQKIRNPIKRIGGLGLHRLVTRHKVAATLAINNDPESRGLQYLGQGYCSVVYRRGEEVIKVVLKSIEMNEFQKRALAEAQQAEHEKLTKYLAKFVLPQVIFVDEHPVRRQKRAVQISQPYCEHSQLSVLSRPVGNINPDDLEDDMRYYPGIEKDLRCLIEGASLMYDQTRLLPDTIGRGNIVVQTDSDARIIIVDGQPISPDLSETQGRILRQLDSLDSALTNIGV